MHDHPSIMAQYDEREEHAERGRRDGKEVDGDDVAQMIVQKGPPRL
jgi:hypothetical protein